MKTEIICQEEVIKQGNWWCLVDFFEKKVLIRSGNKGTVIPAQELCVELEDEDLAYSAWKEYNEIRNGVPPVNIKRQDNNIVLVYKISVSPI